MDHKDFSNFKWLNESSIRFENEEMVLYAPKDSDFFCNNGTVSEEGITPSSLTNAPFFYTEVSGDFVMRVKVGHDFRDVYDSASVMVMKDLEVWAKLCFELTDFDTHAVVSVVTNPLSDDANGNNIDGDSVWLQITRVGQAFAFHYSLNGDQFYMVRFFNLPVEETVKVGFVPQAPNGNGGDRRYSGFSLEKKTVKNIRAGV
ncbi:MULTISPECIES: DUF1349 domain-containing protein [unclassified Paenibacillus]|uniref:DUF1349 domain-containing protein n=1 Tax=unclassified Paenibacillus TaxID=185978 RepID=UPI002405EBA0|nr:MULTISPECIES: DUF1349 domain-containing protein [unclassified Paenibacillus]MDF9841699.1 regulation of enolase protein 1 (concanavalin A-like superfamily) [Paenibacillus sp. PastF-2]MDF9848189.1 regulation of enolase protein 1 (concanavalin A-like superfamily) [Paenibacillus sp. PastM-2]MDF9854858.1 regulation of enolase protein 1 (concanavalin A-like superfamily) [Paenibacillus sp. PastF-1]MDH6480128.1 regulation of enolase protein 1 (concanavalin A-like superfamily) [Paenibacillus sp. Past